MSIVAYGLGPTGTGSGFEPGAVRMSNIKDGDLEDSVLSVDLNTPIIDPSLQVEVLDASIKIPVLDAQGESPKE